MNEMEMRGEERRREGKEMNLRPSLDSRPRTMQGIARVQNLVRCYSNFVI